MDISASPCNVGSAGAAKGRENNVEIETAGGAGTSNNKPSADDDGIGGEPLPALRGRTMVIPRCLGIGIVDRSRDSQPSGIDHCTHSISHPV